jgi:excisionase family DNA binding protein
MDHSSRRTVHKNTARELASAESCILAKSVKEQAQAVAEEEGEQLLTVDQVARRLQLHPATIRRWIKSGRLRAISLGSDRAGWRIRRSELEQFIAGMHRPELPGVSTNNDLHVRDKHDARA